MSAERPGERLAGGLWCRDVLEVLSEYVDGGLEPAIRARVQSHVAACDQCSRFGEEFASVIRALRERLGPAEEPGAEVEARLASHLARVLGPGGGGASGGPGS